MKKSFLITLLLFCSIPSISAMEKQKKHSDITCCHIIGFFITDVLFGCVDNCADGAKESYDEFKNTKEEPIKKLAKKNN